MFGAHLNALATSGGSEQERADHLLESFAAILDVSQPSWRTSPSHDGSSIPINGHSDTSLTETQAHNVAHNGIGEEFTKESSCMYIFCTAQ